MSLLNNTEIPSTRHAARAASTMQAARLRLLASPYPGLRRLECYSHEGVLTVRGRVATFHERQMAWIALCDLAGVEEFVDRVEVVAQLAQGQGGRDQPRAALRRAR
jgi:hypothetical protein